MGLGDFLTSIFNSSLVNTVLQVGTALYGQSQARKANEKAANIMAAATNKNTEAIQAGAQEAKGIYNAQQLRAAPGTNYLSTVVARNPYELTPEQRAGLDEARRQAQARLAASGLRGAGRAVTASIRNVEGDYTNRAVTSNLGSQQSAANTLATEGFSAGTNEANLVANTGVRVGAGNLSAGETMANQETAGGKVAGSTMGAIASVFAQNQKDRLKEKKVKEQMTP